MSRRAIAFIVALCAAASGFRTGSTASVCRQPFRSTPPLRPQQGLARHKPLTPLKLMLVVEPTPFNYISGYTNRFQEMLRALKDAGDQVHIITPDNSKNSPGDFLGFPITTIPGYSLPYYKDVCLSLGNKKIRETMESFKPDIVHVSTPGTLVFRTMSVAKRLNVPLVMSYHTHLPLYAKKYIKIPGIAKVAEFLIRRTHNNADLTLVTSPELKKEMEDIGVQRVAVWEKGVNTEVFSPKFRCNETRHTLTQGSVNSTLLLYVGRLGVEKNLHVLKDVLDIIELRRAKLGENETERAPRFQLALVGSGPAEDELKKMFRNYENVFFAGQLTGEALSKAFASADIFVMPSESETLGFVVLEALASGVPVVAVRAGGIPGVVTHQVTGLLSLPTGGMDSSAFCDHVLELAENKILRNEMSRAGRQYAEKLSWLSATEKLRGVHYPTSRKLKESKSVGRFFVTRNKSLEDSILKRMHDDEELFDMLH